MFANDHIPEAKQTDRWKKLNTEPYSSLQNLPVSQSMAQKCKSVLRSFVAKKKKKKKKPNIFCGIRGHVAKYESYCTPI